MGDSMISRIETLSASLFSGSGPRTPMSEKAAIRGLLELVMEATENQESDRATLAERSLLVHTGALDMCLQPFTSLYDFSVK